ncbi:copper resistance CopC/CopD family protein [Streptomyces sp. SP18CS02]|uniref:copper resistance CopC/CopD family protein n=1 Tax=Streptomyces sp. SP18CS02 TaxID=3002531 RepID=UPI002E77E15F|nr:copper resistance protein CopC [Streptomyces sp. SP18CS02]MEE1754295.1 copper resistance protein CopC [Streptomyces sp. SP18CS02]
MTATAPRFGTTLARLLLVAATLLGALLAGAAPASAHAALTGSDPKDGAVVATAPKGITLTFSEQVAMGDDSIRVLEPSGKRADTGELRDLCSGSVVKYGVDLHAGLPDGTYTVAWQAVSADSHPIAGAYTFSIGAPSKTTVALPAQEAGGGLVGLLYDITRYLSYAGFILLVGGVAFVLACWPRGASVRPMQRLVVRGWLTLTAATLVLLLLRSPYTGSGRLADAFDLGGLGAVLETRTGAALISRLLLLGAAALFVAVLFGAYARREETGEKKDLTFGLAAGGTVVAAGLAGTWALSEHASAGLQPGIAMPVDILHLLAMAAWLGGLTSLLVALYREPSIERAAVRRFSQLAFGSVLVLAATGIYQSWRQVGSWSALTGTPYGRLLLVKVALVAVLVGLAWISRRWTGRLAETTTQPSAPLPAADAEAPGAGEAPEAAEEREAAREASEPAEAPEPTGGAPERAATGEAPVDPERAAQLARQRAAVATAREKRVRDADADRAGLRRSVLAEAGVAVVLLAVTTVLTTTEPGRTQEEADRTKASSSTTVPDRPIGLSLPFDTGGTNGKGTVRLSLDPGRSGANALHVFLDGADGRPLDAPELKVSFTLDAKAIGPLPITPDRVAAGHWSAEAVQIPMPGEWRLQVTVRTSDIDQTTIDKTVKIG